MPIKFCVELSGPLACFTRPEMKVERVSYEVITPSAARACFEAILWKPRIRWHIRRIEVLEPIRWTNIRRNEIANVVALGTVEEAMNSGMGMLAQYVDEERQQRAALLLRDVAYRIHAEMEFLPHRHAYRRLGDARDIALTSQDDETPQKYAEMFIRRARKGQCVNQPYLGTREFAAAFRLVEDPDDERTRRPPIDETRELGYILYDLDYSDPFDPQAMFFKARLVRGVVEVPAWDAPEVKR
ncbi:type I-C CRISPR-associated protein Cas5c [Tepidiphilus margaritifer]|uniref:type I-C CRISPR-associated protein Cas5c n=1 Tax=Tepidiphilus margaritifer TaxID=203471 RepID=UPI000414F117|nr:type I-C CRISPR-associated protein Cas5c [Tepidiphilus margaritifer]